MDNIIIRNRKEEFKELVLYTFFGNMTFVISIAHMPFLMYSLVSMS